MTIIEKVLLYTQKQGIYIDKKEFRFQLESHPEYPSLIAISDTLHFFGISNGALRVTPEEISVLPERFMTVLNDTDHTFSLVEHAQEDATYRVYQERKIHTMAYQTLLSKWKGLVFLIDNTNRSLTEKQFRFSKKYFAGFFLLITLCIFYSTFSDTSNTFQFAFMLLGVIGMLFALAAAENILDLPSALTTKVCQNECHSVQNSKAWRVLNYIDFTDAAIIFFSFQLFGYIIAATIQSTSLFFQIQYILLVLTVPIVLISLFYQQFVLKKWCLLCLSIAGIVLTESILFYIYTTFSLEIRLQQILFFTCILALLTFAWMLLKKQLLRIKSLEQDLQKAIRFKRTYAIFKDALTASKTYHLPKTPLQFGNENVPVTIDFVSNPYCEFCKVPFELLSNLLKTHKNHLQLRFYFNVAFEKQSTESKNFLIQLLHIYETSGAAKFTEALAYWYAVKDYAKWFKKYGIRAGEQFHKKLLQSHRTYFISNKLTFTPVVILNNRMYPKLYELSELSYFINDYIDDHL